MGGTQSTRKITLVNDEKAGVIKLSESLAYRLRGQIEGQQAAAASSPGPAAAPEPDPSPTHTLTSPAPVTPSPEPPAPLAAASLVPEPPSFHFIAPSQVPKAAESPVEGAITSEPSLPAGDTTAATSPPAATTTTSSGVSDLVLNIPEEPTTTIPASQTSGPSQPNVEIAIKAAPSSSLSQPGGNIPPWSIYAEEAHLMVMRLKEEKENEIKNLNHDWRIKMDVREKEFTKMAQLSEKEVLESVGEVERLFVQASCMPVCQEQQEAVMQCYQDHPHQALRCSRLVDTFTHCVDLARLQSVMKERVPVN